MSAIQQKLWQGLICALSVIVAAGMTHFARISTFYMQIFKHERAATEMYYHTEIIFIPILAVGMFLLLRIQIRFWVRFILANALLAHIVFGFANIISASFLDNNFWKSFNSVSVLSFLGMYCGIVPVVAFAWLVGGLAASLFLVVKQSFPFSKRKCA